MEGATPRAAAGREPRLICFLGQDGDIEAQSRLGVDSRSPVKPMSFMAGAGIVQRPGGASGVGDGPSTPWCWHYYSGRAPCSRPRAGFRRERRVAAVRPRPHTRVLEESRGRLPVDTHLTLN